MGEAVDMSRLDDLFARYPEHLTVKQLSEVLGLTVPTAYIWLQKGQVPAYKVGGGWVILRDEVRDHLASGRNIPGDTPGMINDKGGKAATAD